MAYSNQTPNYGLPLPVGTDKSSWLDTNTAFQAVDTALKGAVDGVAALSGTTGGISEALTGLTNRVDGIDTDITQLKNADGTIVGNFGTVETGQVSAHEYAAGDMFVWLNVIRKATVAIHVGDQFVNGTNCVPVILSDVIGNIGDLDDTIANYIKRTIRHITLFTVESGTFKSNANAMLNTVRNAITIYGQDYVYNNLKLIGSVPDNMVILKTDRIHITDDNATSYINFSMMRTGDGWIEIHGYIIDLSSTYSFTRVSFTTSSQITAYNSGDPSALHYSLII